MFRLFAGAGSQPTRAARHLELGQSQRSEVIKVVALGDMTACGVLRAEDFDRAKRFYTEVLGLTLTHEAVGPPREGIFSAGQGTMICIYGRPGLPAPQNTALAFRVPVGAPGWRSF